MQGIYEGYKVHFFSKDGTTPGDASTAGTTYPPIPHDDIPPEMYPEASMEHAA